MINLKTFLLGILLLNAQIIFSQSEICQESKNEKSKLTCFKKEYEKQDKVLNEVYKKLKSKLEQPLVDAMKSDSRLWIERKEFFCTHPIYTQDPKAEEKKASYYSCLFDFTKSRISYLKKAFGYENVKQGIIGDYDDGAGGLLSITKEKNEFKFNVSVARGPTTHVGEMTGILKSTKGDYKWKSLEEGESCELNFSFSDYMIEIKEIACADFHGANAYFDGKFRKIK